MGALQPNSINRHPHIAAQSFLSEADIQDMNVGPADRDSESTVNRVQSASKDQRGSILYYADGLEKPLSLIQLIRTVLSFAVPPGLFPAVIAWSNAAEGFDDDAFRELQIYYVIGLVWLVVTVALWRAIGAKVGRLSPASSLMAIGALVLAAGGLISWNWSDQVSDFHSGLTGCLLTMGSAGVIGLLGAAIYAVLAQVRFRVHNR